MTLIHVLDSTNQGTGASVGTQATIEPQVPRDAIAKRAVADQMIWQGKRRSGSGTYTVNIDARVGPDADWVNISTIDEASNVYRVLNVWPEMRARVDAISDSTTLLDIWAAIP